MSARRTALLGLALALLLGLVAISSRAGRPGRGEASDPAQLPTAVVDSIVTITLLMLIPGGALIVWAFLLRMKITKESGKRGSDLRRALTLLAVVGLVSLAAVLVGQRLLEQRRADAGRAGAPGAGLGTEADDDAAERYDPRFRWFPASVFGLVLVGAAGVFLFTERRRRGSVRKEDEAADAVTRAVEDTLEDLRAEPDARIAVIAAYARMEQALGAFGSPRHRAEAPLEYLSRVLLELHVRPEAVLELTDLFERAKFSPHRIDATMKDEAISALLLVRDDLRALA